MREPPEKLAEQLDCWLREIRQELRRPLEAEFAKGGLTGPQRSVMQALFQSESMSLGELCRHVGLANSTVSGIVDRLEKRGLVKREIDQKDRRYTRLAVTRVVRDFMRKTAPALTRDPLVRAVRTATETEQRAIRRGVATLHRLLIGQN